LSRYYVGYKLLLLFCCVAGCGVCLGNRILLVGKRAVGDGVSGF
jgi:hypothetical protein